jgi:hypothetical protein
MEPCWSGAESRAQGACNTNPPQTKRLHAGDYFFTMRQKIRGTHEGSFLLLERLNHLPQSERSFSAEKVDLSERDFFKNPFNRKKSKNCWRPAGSDMFNVRSPSSKSSAWSGKTGRCGNGGPDVAGAAPYPPSVVQIGRKVPLRSER